MSLLGRLPVAPWLALIAVLLAAVALLLPMTGIAGPWTWVALACTICAALRAGFAAATSASSPATCGAANEVPDSRS